MIQELTLRNFKCFDEFRVPSLSKITLIGGVNGVGKTCLMEGIFAFFDRLNPMIGLRQYGWRGVDALVHIPDQVIGPMFFEYKLANPIAIELTIDGVKERVTMEFVPDCPYTPSAPKGPPKEPEGVAGSTGATAPGRGPALRTKYIVGERTQYAIDFLYLAEEGIRPLTIPPKKDKRNAQFVLSKSVDVTQLDAMSLGELDVSKGTETLLSVLREFDPRVEALTSVAVGTQAVIHADIGLPRKIPAGFLGTGFTRLMHICLVIASNPKNVILIDEIDKGIHYSKLPMVWRAVAKAVDQHDCQLIATTHSWDCLAAATSGLKGLYEPDFTYVRLERVEKRVVPKVLSFAELTTAVENGCEVR